MRSIGPLATEGKDPEALTTALLAMASAFRRSELVAMTVPDLTFQRAGLRNYVPRSKRDQAAEGAVVAIPEGRVIAPVRLLKHWTHHSGDSEETVFRWLSRSDVLTGDPIADKSVARLVKATDAAAELDTSLYSAHSLRSGFLTEAASNRANLFKMKDHARHKSLDTVTGYVRDASFSEDHAGDQFL